jgi:hypothetical protein
MARHTPILSHRYAAVLAVILAMLGFGDARSADARTAAEIAQLASPFMGEDRFFQ